MSTLDSSSTFTNVKAAYLDNMSWEEDASAAKAKAFITACKGLLFFLAEETQQGSERVRQGMNVQEIRREMLRAQKYVGANKTVANGGSGVRHISLEGYRS